MSIMHISIYYAVFRPEANSEGVSAMVTVLLLRVIKLKSKWQMPPCSILCKVNFDDEFVCGISCYVPVQNFVQIYVISITPNFIMAPDAILDFLRSEI